LSKTIGPNTEKETGSWRKLGNKKLHDLSSSLNVTGTIKFRWMRWGIAKFGRGGEGQEIYILDFDVKTSRKDDTCKT